MFRFTQHRRTAPATVVLAAIMAVGGCSGGPDEPVTTTPPATGTVSTTSSPPEDAAKQAVIEVYTKYREAYIAASAVSDAANADLPKYTADPLLSQARFALGQANQQGIVYKGRPTWKATVTSVDLTGRPVKATIEDCLDTTNWAAVYKATGKSAAATGQALRYVVTSTVYRYDDGRWLVAESAADRSRTC